MKEQQGQLKQLKEGSPITIEEVRLVDLNREEELNSRRDKSLRYRKGGARGTQPRIQGGAKPDQRKPQCKPTCPEKAATCYKCNRKGYFSSQCFSKTVAASAEELSLDTAFLGVLNS